MKMCESIIDEIAMQELSRAGCLGPPVDAIALARQMKIEVAIDSRQAQRARYAVIRGQSAIFLQPDKRPERLQWATAHELGEHFAFRILDLHEGEWTWDDGNPALREQIANRFATHLLLPDDWFFDDAERCGYDLFSLKNVYQTASHELIARRMLDGVLPTWITIIDQGQITFRRSNQGGSASRLQPLEEQAWRESQHTSHVMQTSDEQFHVQCWPVHEAGWQREILRTTPVEQFA